MSPFHWLFDFANKKENKPLNGQNVFLTLTSREKSVSDVSCPRSLMLFIYQRRCLNVYVNSCYTTLLPQEESFMSDCPCVKARRRWSVLLCMRRGEDETCLCMENEGAITTKKASTMFVWVLSYMEGERDSIETSFLGLDIPTKQDRPFVCPSNGERLRCDTPYIRRETMRWKEINASRMDFRKDEENLYKWWNISMYPFVRRGGELVRQPEQLCSQWEEDGDERVSRSFPLMMTDSEICSFFVLH